MRIFLIILISILLVFGVFVSSSVALPFYGDQGLEGLGSFIGELTYNAISDTKATLTVELTNTSPEANGGFITAFAFNNPSNDITSVNLSSTDSDFNLIGGPFFKNSIKASPFGKFDIGASISNRWLGGKRPWRGIGVGDTETFTFDLKGINLSSLDEQSFWEVLSLGCKRTQPFAVRFRGFDNKGSDKVPGVPDIPPNIVIPEPSTILLLGFSLIGILGLTRKLGNGR